MVNLIISTGYDAFYELNIPGCCTSAAGGRMRTSYLIERGDNEDVKGGSALTQRQRMDELNGDGEFELLNKILIAIKLCSQHLQL